MSKKRFTTACPMDCPDACSLSVDVENDRIVAIGASDLNPTTQGFICSKISRFARRVYSDDRILTPLERTGKKGEGRFRPISWERAADLICDRFRQIQQEAGGEAILPYYYGGSNGLLAQETADKAFFAKLGASRLDLTVCAAPTTAAAQSMYGKMPGVAFEDYPHAKLIVVWGANPKVSNIHLVPYLRRAKSSGAKLVVLDPIRNFSGSEVDLHLPVYPGTDLVVALALVNIWQKRNLINADFVAAHTRSAESILSASREWPVERAAKIARVDAEQIKKLAGMYAFHDPALIRIGWGLERNRNGGKAAAAILALPALLGKFGRRGAGYTLSNSVAYRVDGRRRVDSPPWNTRVLNMTRLGRLLLEEKDPAIQGLFVYNANPVATVPNQMAIVRGLQRDDLFTVVSEQVMTDTAMFADVILPATTFVEQEEIRNGYGSYATQYLQPVVSPLGEAKPNEAMFAFLGRRMGWEDAAFQECTEDYLQRAAGAITGLGSDVSLEFLRANQIQFFEGRQQTPIQFKDVFPRTPDEKINLAPGDFGAGLYDYTALPESDFPLALISPASNKLTNSTLGEFNMPELILSMNPTDALARKLEAGSRVRVSNGSGEVVARLRIEPRLRPGVVMLPKGAWRKSSQNGWTATALAPDTISPIGQGACFNDARVEVRAAETP